MPYTPEHQTLYAKRFALWLGIAAMVMMFAGFTSAYIVKKADTDSWTNFVIPSIFFVSTAMILLSSVTMVVAMRAFKHNNLKRYQIWLWATFLLGSSFIVLQIIGWMQMEHSGILMTEEVSGAFFYVISGTHAVHVLGGVIILLVSLFGISRKLKDPVYDLTMEISPKRKFRVELVATYWHFVDALWIYLFLFLLYNHS